jgi:nucleoside-triphosphatase THEP1
MNWLNNRNDVSGILTPDVNEKRKLFDIAHKTYHNLEVDANYTGETTTIGKYHFDKKVFDKAQTILLNAMNSNYGWIVVDEIGRLEIDQQKGLEPTISRLIKHQNTHQLSSNLLLVVRDYLLMDCVKHYNINEAVIVNKSKFDSVIAKK